MSTESFATSSGLEIVVEISESGEPESVKWNVPEGRNFNELTENEVLEIAEWIEDYGSDDDEDNNDGAEDASENSQDS